MAHIKVHSKDVENDYGSKRQLEWVSLYLKYLRHCRSFGSQPLMKRHH